MQGELEGSVRYRELTRSAENFFRQSVASKSRWGLWLYTNVQVTWICLSLTSKCICLNVPIVCVVSVPCPRVRRFSSWCAAAVHSTWRSWRNKSHSSPKRTVSGSKISVFEHWNLVTIREALFIRHFCMFMLLISSEQKEVEIRDITPLSRVLI